jgi:hypothetical protein
MGGLVEEGKMKEDKGYWSLLGNAGGSGLK